MSLIQVSRTPRKRFPPWLKKRIPLDEDARVAGLVDGLELETICQSGQCPNRGECWAKGTATFMLMGEVCTRRCGFCAVPKGPLQALDAAEPQKVAEAVAHLGLRHAVVTSVNRDDLPDGGAPHFAATVTAIRERSPGTTVEILTPDFTGKTEQWAIAADSRPEVYNHNVETVPRLYKRVRPGSRYPRSMDLLGFVKRRHPDILTKSGVMLGLGESVDEVMGVGRDLREQGVDLMTLGQYLQPGPGQLPVEEFVHPDTFAELRERLMALGFLDVAAGPFVRSSYNADEVLARAQARDAEGR